MTVTKAARHWHWHHLLLLAFFCILYVTFITTYLTLNGNVAFHTARDTLHPNTSTLSYSSNLRRSDTTTGDPILQASPPHIAMIPHIIHQTWKTSILPEWAKDNVQSWKTTNPTYEHKLWDDAAAAELIQSHYPKLWPIYNKILHPVQRADVFRYAVVHQYGGVYADIDVLNLIPIDQWSTRDDHFTVEMMVGWEALPSAKEVAKKHFAVEYQLCQWTFAAMKGHWLLGNVLEDIASYYTRGEHEKSLSIIKSTGPGMFSISVRRSLEKIYGSVSGSGGGGVSGSGSGGSVSGSVSGSSVSGSSGDPEFGFGRGAMTKKRMKQSITRIGGLHIMPLESFGSRGQENWRPSKNVDNVEKRLVMHRFRGSWKEEHAVRKKQKRREDDKKEKEAKKRKETMREDVKKP